MTVNKTFKVAIIGAGASGLCAAIEASKRGNRVTVFDGNEIAGKKILSTGNGHCNFLNRDQNISHFHSHNEAFVNHVLGSFPASEIENYFENIGMAIMDKQGYLYPKTAQAATVRKILERTSLYYGVIYHLLEPVMKLIRKEKGFTIITNVKEYHFDKVILACGTPAGAKKKDWLTGIDFAQNLSISSYPFLPALVQLISDHPVTKKWNGVRIKGKVSIAGTDYADTGELMLTDYGISGIPVFQISGICAQMLNEHKKVSLLCDFEPDMSANDLYQFIHKMAAYREDMSMLDILAGLLPAKLLEAISSINIKSMFNLDSFKDTPFEKCRKDLDDSVIQKIILLIKQYEISIVGTKSMEQAQICSGGIAVTEVNPNTMECIKIPGLYITGELLDVNGDCGGYNLQWAWTTGLIAGQSINKRTE